MKFTSTCAVKHATLICPAKIPQAQTVNQSIQALIRKIRIPIHPVQLILPTTATLERPPLSINPRGPILAQHPLNAKTTKPRLAKVARPAPLQTSAPIERSATDLRNKIPHQHLGTSIRVIELRPIVAEISGQIRSSRFRPAYSAVMFPARICSWIQE